MFNSQVTSYTDCKVHQLPRKILSDEITNTWSCDTPDTMHTVKDVVEGIFHLVLVGMIPRKCANQRQASTVLGCIPVTSPVMSRTHSLVPS